MLHLARFLAVVLPLLVPAKVIAQSIETDSFIQENIARENWEPGGKFSTLPTRGTVITSTRTGQVDVIPQHTQRVGSFSLQSANVQGQYGYTVDITSNHPHTVHSPFNVVDTDSDSDRINRPDGSQASIELNWTGTRVHPDNGYDPPAGGGFPTPDPRGAIDNYSYEINGIATGVFPLSNAERQRLDPPSTVLGRLSRAGELISDDFLSGLRRASQGIDDFSTDAGLRDNLNAFLDTVTGAGRTVLSPVTGGITGFGEAEIVNAVTAIADTSVEGKYGFKAFDVREQYALLSGAGYTSDFLSKNPEIAKTIEALGYLAPGAAIIKKSIKGPKIKIDPTTTIKGKTCVYSCVVDGTTRYVGITDDIARRGSEHLRSKGLIVEEIPGLTNLTRADARAVEQTLIHYHGLGKDGGTLVNKINSISPTKNPTDYEKALINGRNILRDAQYPGF